MTATTTTPRRTAGTRPARGRGGAKGKGSGDGRPRRRRLVWPLLIGVTVIGIVFIGVYPTRTWLAQRSSLRDANHQLQVLKQQNDALAAQVNALNTDSEIERIARERYNLVRPGEESYAINPPPLPAVEVPSVWPFTALAAELAATPAH